MSSILTQIRYAVWFGPQRGGRAAWRDRVASAGHPVVHRATTRAIGTQIAKAANPNNISDSRIRG